MTGQLNTAGASARTGVPAETLKKWRYLSRGPAYTKLGRLAYYDVAELDAWIKANRKTA